MVALADLSWTAIVGIAGIIGTVTVSIQTNRHADRRQRESYAQEDRTRFHKERIEIYARFLKASQACRMLALKYAYLFTEHAGGDPPEDREQRPIARHLIDEASAELFISVKAVELVATESVFAAALVMFDSLKPLVIPHWKAVELLDIVEKADLLEAGFITAARTELLPQSPLR